MPSPNCIITAGAAATVWSDPAVPESLLRGIAADPGSLVRAAACHPVKIDFESLVVQSQWPAGGQSLPVAVKQYRPRSLGKALAAIFRPAKAMQNWRKAEFLLAREIATPRPLLACRPRGWMASSTSYLVTAWIGGAENLHLFGWRIAARPLAARLRLAARCAEALGRLLGRMHASGAAHRDLKAANLLVVEVGREAIVYLVDLDGLRPGPAVRFRRQARDLARLAAGLAAHAWVTRPICGRFLRAYFGEFPAAGNDWKPLWRAIAKETAAYVRRKQKRGEKVL
jgi:tRNA A-37 threonylcarbamoyl transferase component Bud32